MCILLMRPSCWRHLTAALHHQPIVCALKHCPHCLHAQAELAGIRTDNERLRARLDESKEQLTSNEQMIRWLNQQVTEAQLSMTTAVPGSSRYTFRPSSTIATPAAGLLGAAPGSAYPTR
jgi:hypothetical protein